MAGKVEFKKPRKSNVTDVSGGKVSGWREWPTMSNATARTKNFPRSLPLVQPKNKAFITLPPSLRPPSLSHSHSLTLSIMEGSVTLTHLGKDTICSQIGVNLPNNI